MGTRREAAQGHHGQDEHEVHPKLDGFGGGGSKGGEQWQNSSWRPRACAAAQGVREMLLPFHQEHSGGLSAPTNPLPSA